jgi:hypothetical protein
MVQHAHCSSSQPLLVTGDATHPHPPARTVPPPPLPPHQKRLTAKGAKQHNTGLTLRHKRSPAAVRNNNKNRKRKHRRCHVTHLKRFSQHKDPVVGHHGWRDKDALGNQGCSDGTKGRQAAEQQGGKARVAVACSAGSQLNQFASRQLECRQQKHDSLAASIHTASHTVCCLRLPLKGRRKTRRPGGYISVVSAPRKCS